MQTSVRILTWNVQLRSYAMEALDRTTLEVEYSAKTEVRATAIAERINARAKDYDIICFNEVFDEDAREIFVSALKNNYPFFIRKADINFFNRLGSHVIFHISPDDLDTQSIPGSPEDSGLMFFSKFEFDIDRPSFSLTPTFGNYTATYFGWFALAAGHDLLSSKGILSVRLKLPSGERIIVLSTHMQADSNDDGENYLVRKSQIALFSEIIDSTRKNAINPLPANHDVIVLGDLNINGISTNTEFPEEWKYYFARPHGLLNDSLWDAWTYEQCPGALIPFNLTSPVLYPTDKGITADTKQEPPERRFDYCLLKPKHSGRKRKVQHIFKDTQLKAPVKDVPFLSDHYPVVIDLHLEDSTAMNTMEAIAIQLKPGTQAGIPNQFNRQSELNEGIVHWLRLDERGTYDFAMPNGDFIYELYDKDNLSDQQLPYKKISKKDTLYTRAPIRVEKFVLPDVPTFIKIIGENRYITGTYNFSLWKYTGTSLDDAIVLLKDTRERGEHKVGAPTSNTTTTFGSESSVDSLFFSFDIIKVTSGRAQTITIDFQPEPGAAPMRVLLGRRILDNIDVLANSQLLTTSTKLNKELPAGEYFIIVQRVDAAFSKANFTISWNTNVSTLLGTQPLEIIDDTNNPTSPYGPGLADLLCIADTQGWGADDIFFLLRLDGEVIIHKTFLGGMNDGQALSILPWIPEPLTYIDTIELFIIEGDAIDSDDRTSILIPGIRRLAGSNIPYSIHNGCYHISVTVDFSDGRYKFTCRLV